MEMKLAAGGKRLIAQQMCANGQEFLAAGILLNKHPGTGGMVVLHNLCQGCEVLLKGILLARDYDRYQPKLRSIGHKLVKAWDTVMAELRLPSASGEFLKELQHLSDYYSNHLLRYASALSLLVDADTIPRERVLHRVVALLRLVQHRKLI